MKTCTACGEEKPLNEFYLHGKKVKRTTGKCKSCTRRAVNDRRLRLEATDLNWRLSEMERHREKSAKARREGRVVKQSPEKRAECLRRHAEKYPEKAKARQIVSNAIRDGKLQRQPCHCGAKAQAHHEDYSKPLDVTWLCPKHHAEHEVQMRRQKLVRTAVLMGFGFM